MEVVTATTDNVYDNGTDFKTLASSYIMYKIGKIVLLQTCVFQLHVIIYPFENVHIIPLKFKDFALNNYHR